MMPLKSRSLRTTSLKSEAVMAEAPLREARSATATVGLLTPRPVPVRNQSCAAAGAAHCKAPSMDSSPRMATARQAPNRLGVILFSVLNVFSLCLLYAQGKSDFDY